MKKLAGLVLTVPLLFGGLAACGGSDSTSGTSTPAATTEASAAPTMEATAEATTDATAEATTGSTGSAVDDYCAQVDEYAQKFKDLQANPNTDTANELQATAKKLQDTASQLTQELIDDPSQATKVQECTTKLQQTLGQ